MATDQSTALRLTRPLALVATFTVAIGCSTTRELPVETPVKGVVLVNGHPAKGVCVQFHPLSTTGSLSPEGARTDEDGSYIVPVNRPGEYAVTATWPVVQIVEGEELEGADRLQGRYNNRGRPVKKVTIGEKSLSLEPLQLTSR